MRLAVHRRRAALNIEVRLFGARFVRATPAADVHHVLLGVFLAVDRCRVPGGVVARCPRAGVLRATPAAEVDHAGQRVLFAIRPLLATLRFKAWLFLAGIMRAATHLHGGRGR